MSTFSSGAQGTWCFTILESPDLHVPSALKNTGKRHF